MLELSVNLLASFCDFFFSVNLLQDGNAYLTNRITIPKLVQMMGPMILLTASRCSLQRLMCVRSILLMICRSILLGLMTWQDNMGMKVLKPSIQVPCAIGHHSPFPYYSLLSSQPGTWTSPFRLPLALLRSCSARSRPSLAP